MSLSEHEKLQFERLTTGLDLGDALALKKMAKIEKETAMSYMAFPGRNMILMVLALIGMIVSSVGLIAQSTERITDNGILLIAFGASSLLLITTVFGSTREKPSAANRNTDSAK
jgi:hypothetical protein